MEYLQQLPFLNFYIWMLHGSTKVVVRTVALLSAKTEEKVAMSLGKLKYFRKATTVKTTTSKRPTSLQSPRECKGIDAACLFLGQLNSGLVGNVESTHVNCPKGKDNGVEMLQSLNLNMIDYRGVCNSVLDGGRIPGH